MTNKKLSVLIVVAVVLVALAFMTSNSNKVKAPSQIGKELLTTLDLSEIARIETGVPDGDKAILESTDTGWVVKSLHGYPADITKIRTHLMTLKDLKIGALANAATIENPVVVDLQDASGKPLATLQLGEKHMRQPVDEAAQYGGGSFPSGRYLSVAGDASVYLVKETLDEFDGDAKKWCDNQIASISSADIKAVALAHPDEVVKLEKKDGAWEMAGLGEKEEFDTSKSYSLESGLSYLSFNDVVDPSRSDAELGLTTGVVYQVTLNSGEQYTAKIGNKVADGSDRYFAVSASFTPTGTNEVENTAISKKVEEFNGKVSQWRYAISSYNADNMSKRRSDLVKTREDPEKKRDEDEKKGDDKKVDN